jgi:DNA-directed RNA polymerase specialized sigma24 family protein
VRETRSASGQAAFAALYRRYLAPLYRYLYVRTGDVGAAEDLTSQTFVAALEGLPRYRERGTFAGWLFTIVARKRMDERKAIEQLKRGDIQVQAVRAAYLVTRDRDQAEEIVQAAFLRS